MNEFSVTNQDAVKVERIRRQYMKREENKMEQLKRLDDKVKVPGKIIASIMGVTGTLVMGSGMSLIMVWERMSIGLALGIPGLLVTVLAYPVYKMITGGRKKKYADEIMELSEELIGKE